MSIIKWSQVPILYNLSATTKICVIDGADPRDKIISADNLFTSYLTSYRLDAWDDYIVGVSEKMVLSAYLGYTLKLRLDALDLEDIAYKSKNNIFTKNNTFNGEVYAKYIDLNSTIVKPTYKEGRFFYDNSTNSLSIYNDLPGEYHILGRQFRKRVTNETGSTISKGKVVYINSNSSGLPVIELAQTTFYNSSRILGVVTSDIPSGSMGDVVTLGDLEGLDLSLLANGLVYLSPDNPGELTSIRPTEEHFIVIVGLVEKIANNNTLYIFPSSTEYTAESVNINGFPSYEQGLDRIIEIDNATRIFSIKPAIGRASYYYYQYGVKYTSSSTTSLTIADTKGLHLIYFDKTILKEIVNPTFDEVNDIYLLYVPVAVITWSALDQECTVLANEMHTFGWPNALLAHNHITLSAVYGMGLDITIVDTQFSLSSGSILTEDVITDVPDIALASGLPIIYRVGDSIWERDYNTGYSYLVSLPYDILYNKNTNGTWSTEVVPLKHYTFVHVFAQNNIYSEKIVALMGTEEYTSSSAAEFGLELEVQELYSARKEYLFSECHLYSIIIQTDKGEPPIGTVWDRGPTIIMNSKGTLYYDFRRNKTIYSSGARTLIALTDTPDVYSTPTKPIKVTDVGAIWENIFEENITLSDITLLDVNNITHGLVPKAVDDSSKFLRSDGSWAVVTVSSGDFLDSVIAMQKDNTLDPGTPADGDRYILLDVATLHANFGTIDTDMNNAAVTLGNNDIVQYVTADAKFKVAYDSSASMQPATVTVGIDKNGNSNHDWTYDVTSDTWVDRGTTLLHNSLTDLNTGAGQFYHLTSSQLSGLTGGSVTTLHSHASIASPAALTRTSDTNVILTLGGSPTTALLAATSLTLSWAGSLSILRGGTNSSTSLSGHSIMISDGASIIQGAKGTTTTVLHGNASGAPTYGQIVTNDIANSNVTFAKVTNVSSGVVLGKLTPGSGVIEEITAIPNSLVVGSANWNNAYNNMITAASFNTSTGLVTLTQQDAGTVTVNLDGRYMLSTGRLLNDQWFESYDYAGNIANLFKISKDNNFVIAPGLEVSTLYAPTNAGRVNFIKMPVGVTTAGQEMSLGMAIGTRNQLRVVGITNSTGGLSDDYVWITSRLQLDTIPHETTNVNKFLVSNNGAIRYRTASELALDTGFTLLNDEWFTSFDYAGNVANIFKISKENVIEFGHRVGIDALMHVMNSGLNDIVDIPVSSASTSGTEHGIGISVGAVRLLKISGLSDGSGGIGTGVLTITGNIISQAPNASGLYDLLVRNQSTGLYEKISSLTYGNYNNWKFATNGTTQDAINSGEILNFKNGSNISITRSLENEITIANTYSYSHPTYSAIGAQNLTGASVFSSIVVDTLGSVTSISTRIITLGDLGFTGSTTADNYNNWKFATNGTTQDSITTGVILDFVNGSNISITRSALNKITISSSYTDTNTTYSTSAISTTGGAFLRLTGSDSSTDDLKFAGGSNITVSYTDASTITIANTYSYSHPGYTPISAQNLTGASVFSNIVVDSIGSVTSVSTRSLTLSDLGFSGSTTADNYGYWVLQTNSANNSNITSTATVNFIAGTNITLSKTGNSITITSTASGSSGGTVTNVTAGNGMTQTGTSSIDPTLNIVSHAGSAGTIGTINIGADAIGVNLGTSNTTAAAGDHTHSIYAASSHSHGNITSTGYIGVAANQVVTTGVGGIINTVTTGSPGQYLTSSYLGGPLNWTNIPDVYSYWTLQANSSGGSNITSGSIVNFTASGSTTVSRSGNTINISSSGGLSGGTTNYHAIWTSASTLSASSIYEDASFVYSTKDMKAGNFISTSDRRKKMNQKPIDLSRGLAAEFWQFEMIDKPGDIRYGLFAQDLLINDAELVVGSHEDGYQVKMIDALVREVAYLRHEIKLLKEKTDAS